MLLVWQHCKLNPMKRRKIRFDFSNYSDAAFLAIAKIIATNIAAASAIFTDPVPDIADVANTVTAFQDALAAAGNGGKNEVALKNAIRGQLDQMLYELGLYVMFVAKGNEDILIRSGYPIVKERTPSQLGMPGMVTLSIGITSGDLLAKFKKPTGTLALTFQITDVLPTSATVWTNELCTGSKFLFTGLTPGKQYWVRVLVVGSGTQNAISPVSSMFVL